MPRPLPTPVLAVSITDLGCAAGVMVTASHNPPKDNGYKVYLGEGAQIVPPADTEISAAIDAVGPVADIPMAAARRSAHRPPRRAGHRALPRPRAGRAPRAVGHRREGRLHPDARRRRRGPAARLRAGRLPRAGGRRGAVRARSRVPDRELPEPRGARRHGSAAGAGPPLGRRHRHRQRPRRRPLGRGHPERRGERGGRLAEAVGRRDRLAAQRPHPPPHDGRRPARGHHGRLVDAPRPDGRGLRRPLRRDLHGLQVDRPRRAGATRRSGSCSATSRPSATSSPARPSTRTASPRPSSWPRSRRWPRPMA